jgi:tRNA G18 (ribose-2'-O)-methylase SpoU
VSATDRRPDAAGPRRITDPHDPRLADYAALTDAELRKRYEHDVGVLIAEGPTPVRALVSSPYPVRSVLLDEDRLPAMADVVAAVDAPVYTVTRELLYEVVRFRLHQGVLACGQRLPAASLDGLTRSAATVVLLEAANDHENLGTLFRSARGLGADGVVLAPGCADPLYRRSVRVSMGHVLHLPFAWASSLADAFETLHDHGFVTVALTPADDAIDLRDVEQQLTSDTRVAVVLGAEGPGLTDEALAMARIRARIAMHDGVDSINVAAAGAIALDRLRTRPRSG